MQFATQSVSRTPVAAKPDALHLLEQFGATFRVLRGQEIHMEGDPATHCYRVVGGCVRTVRSMEDGRRQVGEFLTPGDMFGLDVLDVHDLGAEAVVDSVLRRYPRRMVEGLADSNPALARRLREQALVRLRAAHERILLLGRATATERISSFLLEMAERGGGERGFVELPMCRTDIADYLGLTIETVCRVLAAIKRDGLIGIWRTGVDVRDADGLRALAHDTRH